MALHASDILWTTWARPLGATDYNPNELNQYENAITEVSPKLIPQGFGYDTDGNLSEMFVVGDANCDGAVNNFDVDCFVAAASGDYQAYLTAGGSAACWAERHEWGDFDGDGQCTNLDIDPFVDLLGANGSGAAIALRFEWDGENRLTRVTYPDDCGAGMPNGFQRVSFKYDYLGRRIEKKVETCSASGGTWSTAARRLYVYDQWNLLLELDATTSGSPVLRKYTWGLDLAGQSGDASAAGLHGAGGIGGLLAVDVQTADPDTAETGGFWFCFDANGNVLQLVAGVSGYGGASGDEWHADRLKARYEYDPYGKLDNTPSAFGLTNPFRFSTKYWVDPIGLGDWGYRWYDPRAGRWISRDPIGESPEGGLYSFGGNRPTLAIDLLGASLSDECQTPPALPPASGPTSPPSAPPVPSCAAWCLSQNLSGEWLKFCREGCDAGRKGVNCSQFCDKYRLHDPTVYYACTRACRSSPGTMSACAAVTNSQSCPVEEPGHRRNDGWCDEGRNSLHCPPAAGCYRGYDYQQGKQCCYDALGCLIGDGFPGAGTSDRVGPAYGESASGKCDWGDIPVRAIRHFICDVVPSAIGW